MTTQTAAQPLDLDKPLTGEDLMRLVFQRPDVSPAGREAEISYVMRGRGELTLAGGDFDTMAKHVNSLVAHARAAQPESATGTTGADEQVKLDLRVALTEATNQIADLRAQLAARGQDEAFRDVVSYGTGVLQGGKHIPYADIYAAPASAQAADALYFANDGREPDWAGYAAAEAGLPEIKELVNRFLGWPMPDSLSARIAPNVTKPIGTHLMNADEAKAMFEHCLQGAAVAPSDAKGKADAANAGGLLTIHSAPKDGTEVIGFDGRRHFQMQWVACRGSAEPCWHDLSANRWAMPTHWMPLPTVLPSQSATSAADAKDAHRLNKFIDWYLRGGTRAEINPDGHTTFTTREMVLAWLDSDSAAISIQQAALVAKGEQSTLPRLYRFDRYKGACKLADGVGVHAASMAEALEKVRELAAKLNRTEGMQVEGIDIKFASNEPCAKAVRCSICNAYAEAQAQSSAKGGDAVGGES